MEDAKTETETETPETPGMGLGKLAALFEALAAEETATVRDCYGGSHEISTVLSMRQEMQVAALLDRMATTEDAPVVLFTEAQAMVNAGKAFAGLRHMVMGLVRMPSLHGILDQLLGMLLADAIAEVRKNPKCPADATPIDMFRTGDVVGALGRFFGQSVSTLAQEASRLLGDPA